MCDMLKIVVSRVWPCQYIHWYQWYFDLFLISVIHVYEIDKLVDLFICVVPRHQRSIVLNFICWKSELVSHNHSGIQTLCFLILDNHVVFKVTISPQLFYNQIYCTYTWLCFAGLVWNWQHSRESNKWDKNNSVRYGEGCVSSL